MKKQFLLFSLLFALCSIIAVGQDNSLAKFDDGILSWYSWDAANAPVDIVTNPSFIGNRSDSCAALLAHDAWKGIALWNEIPVLTPTTVAVAVDVYSNTAGTVKLHGDNSLSGGDNIEVYKNIAASTWTHLVFDISGTSLDHKQIAFQNGVADTLYIDNVTLLDAVPPTYELLKGGSMEYEAAWSPYWNTFDAKDAGSFEFNYTDDGPTAGEGGCYRVTSAGQAANMLWQPVTIVPGHKYKISGAYKYLADTAVGVWVELFITRVKPVYPPNDTVSSEIVTAMGYGMNTWMAPDNVNLDGTFEDDFLLANVDSVVFEIPDTVTQTEWYFAFKAGSWNGLGDTEPVYDLCIDEISLKDMTLINYGGNMEDSTAWNTYWNTFDAKDVGTYEFNYTDDGPTAGEGGCYRVTGAGQAANMLFQPVEINPGHQYYLTGAYKYIADTAINVWVEYFLTRIKPVYPPNDSVSSEIVTAMGYGMNTWAAPDNVNLDGTFQDNFTLANVDAVKFVIPDTVTQTEWYLAMKAGCWNDLGSTEPVFDLLFDEIYMYDLGFPPDTISFPITFETGDLSTWTQFSNGPEPGDPANFTIVDNPDKTGINTSDKCVKFIVVDDAAQWAGAFSNADYTEDYTITEENHLLEMMVYKDKISRTCLKVEGDPGGAKEIFAENTVTGEWELLVFDATDQIGKTHTLVVFMPDFPAEARTEGGTNYVDNIGWHEGSVAVKEVNGFDMTVYPNPTADVLTVKYPGIDRITISNMVGQTVRSIEYNRVPFSRVNVSDLKSGVYLLKIEADGVVTSSKFIKR